VTASGRWLSPRPGVSPVISSPAGRRAAAVAEPGLRLFWGTAPVMGTAGSDGRPPLLLLHGIGTTHDDFATLARKLSREFLVLAPDLPGHGRSPALPVPPTVPAISDALEMDLDSLRLGSVHVLGNSLGGRVALELAARGRVRSVVAVAPSGMGFPAERLYQAAALATARVALRPVRRLMAPAARFAVPRALLLTGLRAAPWRAGQAEVIGLRDGLVNSADFWRLLWHCVLLDVPAGLARIDVPVVLAQGTADLLAGGQTPRYLLQLPSSRFRPLLGGGHAPHTDTPAALADLVHEATAASIERATERNQS
jgi:pimeloyl-ACP methyl ester carboxylesterase